MSFATYEPIGGEWRIANGEPRAASRFMAREQFRKEQVPTYETTTTDDPGLRAPTDPSVAIREIRGRPLRFMVREQFRKEQVPPHEPFTLEGCAPSQPLSGAPRSCSSYCRCRRSGALHHVHGFNPWFLNHRTSP